MKKSMVRCFVPCHQGGSKSILVLHKYYLRVFSGFVDLRNSTEAERPVDSGKMIFGVRLSSNSSIPRLLPNETTHQPVSIGPSSHAQSPVAQLGEQNKSSLNGADTTTDKQASVSSVLSGPPSQQQSPSAHFKEQNGNSPNGAGTLGDPFLANQTSLESNVPRMPSQIPSSAPQLEEQNRNSLNGAQTPVDPFVGNQTSQGETSENLPEITDSELPKTPGDSNSFLVLLFEKFLSASDADRKLARLVLPKLCAESRIQQARTGNFTSVFGEMVTAGCMYLKD